jgi:hypothetical protein
MLREMVGTLRFAPLRISDQISNSQDTRFRILAARSARGLREFFALKTEGVGNAGCATHPQPRVRNKTEHTSVVTARFAEIARHSRTQWF